MSNDLPAECKIFEQDVGLWSAEMTVREPGGPVTTSRGTATVRLTGHGRWLVTDFRTDSGDFEGHSLMGFDPTKGSYVYTWVDSMRPFLAVGEGTWDGARKIMTIITEARMSEHTMRWREVSETVDANTRIFRSFMPAVDDKEIELITAVYKRQAR